jgi:hypothetical protein
MTLTHIVRWEEWNEKEKSFDLKSCSCSSYEEALGVKDIMDQYVPNVTIEEATTYEPPTPAGVAGR